jgi:lipoprotein-anchoring transpeptidase ErfK/SrfK
MRNVSGLRWLAAAAIMSALPLMATVPAQAQSWWGGENSVYDKATVSFSKSYTPGQIVVSFGDRRLYHVIRRGEAVSYPIAVPREQSRWQGVLSVSQKRVNPSWTPTPSMRQENPKLPAFVPGGHPMNPLGNRALYLGSTLYRIHGTDAPWTIGQNVSKGCIRMHNEHVQELFNRVRVGTRVTATWKRYQTTTVASSSGGSQDESWKPF